MKKENVIKKVVLQLGGKEVELSIDDAKKLHEALNELFQQKVITVDRYVHHEYPWRWTYTYPYYPSTLTVTPSVTPTTVGTPWLASNGTSFKYDSGSHALMCSVS